MSKRAGGSKYSVNGIITSAISLGAPTYNMGDYQGCFDIYKTTANSLMKRGDLSTSDRAALESGFRNAGMSN